MHAKSDDGNVGMNSIGAGGMDADGSPLGVNWEGLTANSIKVFRRSEDAHAGQVRVRIWSRAHKIYLPLVLRN